MFEGSFVALVTPFKNGRVDEPALRALVDFQIANGTQGIVPCGTTGESATLSHAEHDEVIRIVVDACKGKIPVLAGTGSNSTDEAITLTQHAQAAGASGSLLITPYYNKPSQEGLYRHFKTVAAETDLPVILYNVPGRTSVNMLPNTVKRLSEIKNIVGVKEASGSLSQITEIIALCGDDFTVLSGDDGLLWPILCVGGKGVISVTSNILPSRVAALCQAARDGEMEKARKIHHELFRINEILFIETNPVPVKAALHLMGKIDDEVRSPLAPLMRESFEKLKSVLSDYSL
ncbi:MAG: 4-hydroxy-tetrahydrodipicolinate synthase [Nitrospinae bacterium CG11_big_fil_rev_8_21_14_0_20_45_15]|nr:MAG: 4-hydroxy-tetrahydrodipicolinate synthase [Nitrospinae bacterium CG11_big_fil_rev_8_21_14_0_20_45_15]